MENSEREHALDLDPRGGISLAPVRYGSREPAEHGEQWSGGLKHKHDDLIFHKLFQANEAPELALLVKACQRRRSSFAHTPAV